MAYRVYVTDCLKHIGHLDGTRYIDAVNDMFKPVETRTGEEIQEDLKTRINTFAEEGG